MSNVNSALRQKHEQERLRDISKRIEAYEAVVRTLWLFWGKRKGGLQDRQEWKNEATKTVGILWGLFFSELLEWIIVVILEVSSVTWTLLTSPQEARDDELERVVKNYSELNLTQPMPGCPEHLARHLLHHGDLRLRDPHTSKMDVHVFLFTDLLLITKVTQRKAEKVKVGMVALENLRQLLL